MRATITLLTSCMLLVAGGRESAAATHKIVLPSGEQRTEAYLAEPEGSGPFPAVLFLHGGRGGIVGGDPQQSAAALVRAGYVALAPLRLQRGSLREEFRQTQAAILYLQNLANVDRDRVAVVGFSRGGLLALMAAVRSDDIDSAVLMAPAPGRGALERALAMATAETPPTLILVAKNDIVQTDHVALARESAQRLRQAGGDARLILYPPFGGKSGDGHQLFFAVRSSYWKDIVTFLAARFGRPNFD